VEKVLLGSCTDKSSGSGVWLYPQKHQLDQVGHVPTLIWLRVSTTWTESGQEVTSPKGKASCSCQKKDEWPLSKQEQPS
jgi:hypothetical protein